MKSSRAFSLVELSIALVIIAILIAGILEASNLIKQVRLSAARSLSRGSDVSSIKDMVLWLDATAEGSLTNRNDSTIVSDANPIKTWVEQNFQSAPRLSFTQSTNSVQPLYEEDGINNLPTLFFDSDADCTPGYALSKSYDAILNPPEFTIFVVLKPIGSGSNNGYFIKNYSGGFGTFAGFDLYKNSTNFSFESADGTDFKTSVDPSTITLNIPYIFTGRRTTLVNSLYKNGTRVDTDTDNAAHSPASSGSFTIGCGMTDGSANCFDGYISEIIMYSRALNIEERRAVESYLGKKYAISVSFVAGQ